MIKLYTDVAGKELNEKWGDNFGAWTEENRYEHETYKGEFYSFTISEENVRRVVWKGYEARDWCEYDYVVKIGIKNINFELVKN
jgi:hypothetical protein